MVTSGIKKQRWQSSKTHFTETICKARGGATEKVFDINIILNQRGRGANGVILSSFELC